MNDIRGGQTLSCPSSRNQPGKNGQESSSGKGIKAGREVWFNHHSKGGGKRGGGEE